MGKNSILAYNINKKLLIFGEFSSYIIISLFIFIINRKMVTIRLQFGYKILQDRNNLTENAPRRSRRGAKLLTGNYYTTAPLEM